MYRKSITEEIADSATKLAIASVIGYVFGRAERGQSTKFGLVGVKQILLNKLLSAGHLEGVPNDDLMEDETLCSGLNIVYDDDVLECFLQDYGTPDLMPFLLSAFFVEYEKELNKFTLISSMPLAESLPKFYKGIADKIPSFAAANKEAGHLKNVLNFCGRHYVCDFTRGGMRCGDPMCHSEYAWIQDGVCFLSMSSGSVGVNSMQLYPFRTLEKRVRRFI